MMPEGPPSPKVSDQPALKSDASMTTQVREHHVPQRCMLQHCTTVYLCVSHLLRISCLGYTLSSMTLCHLFIKPSKLNSFAHSCSCNKLKSANGRITEHIRVIQAYLLIHMFSVILLYS